MTRLQKTILNGLRALTERLSTEWGSGARFPTPIGGKFLNFSKVGSNLGHDVVGVFSAKGGFRMGTIEWSSQWRRAKFTALPDAVFDQQCVAEVYAAMKELK